MYIRRTQTLNNATGEAYFTYRLVRSERIVGKVKPVTLLGAAGKAANLGG